MRPPHRILDRKKVHRLAAEHLQAHLRFKGYKRKISARVLWSLLLAAAARITSLSQGKRTAFATYCQETTCDSVAAC